MTAYSAYGIICKTLSMPSKITAY